MKTKTPQSYGFGWRRSITPFLASFSSSYATSSPSGSSSTGALTSPRLLSSRLIEYSEVECSVSPGERVDPDDSEWLDFTAVALVEDDEDTAVAIASIMLTVT